MVQKALSIDVPAQNVKVFGLLTKGARCSGRDRVLSGVF